MNLLTTCLVSILLITGAISSEPDLESQNNDDYLNPVNDLQSESPVKHEEKRTLWPKHHGWAKHVGLHPSGHRFVLGYGPVDLKYVPVIKPITIRAHHNHHFVKPQWPNKQPGKPVVPIRPVKPVHDGWKPVVPVNVPAPPYGVHKPWQQNGWVFTKPLRPVKPFVPSRPLIPVVPGPPPPPPRPIVPVFPGPAPGVPLFPAPAPVPGYPLVPAPGPIAGPYPIPVAPGPAFHVHPNGFIEVARPNLPVLPLGATFHTPILPPAPVPAPAPVAFPAPYPFPAPAVPVHAPVPVPAPYPAPVLPAPAVPVHAPLPFPAPAPGTVVEYHGTHNYVPFQQVPVSVGSPVIPAQQVSVHPEHAYPVQHPALVSEVPLAHPPHEQHEVQIPLIPQNHPNFLEQQTLFHPRVPIDVPQGVIQEPVNDFLNEFRQPGEPDQSTHVLYQHQNPLSVHHAYSQNVNTDHSNFYIQQSLDVPNIQPGQTDLQIPLHLPHHPNYHQETSESRLQEDVQDQDNFSDQARNFEGGFKPSVSLEAPYTHK